MRILVDLPDRDLSLLRAVAKRLGISRAEFIRRALVAALAPYRTTMSHEAFGLWASHPVDGLAYQERMRSEW
jgi:metal-responsive CopG/Arc/MetJ family transcriptional regulator